MYEHYVDVLAGTEASGRLFRRAYSASELKRRLKIGDTRQMGFENNYVIGKQSFSKYTKAMAERCGFVNPERHTAHGKRKEGISAMSNAVDTLDGKMIMTSARHKSEKLSFKYRKPNDVSREKKYKAILDKGNYKYFVSTNTNNDGSTDGSTEESEESIKFVKTRKRKKNPTKIEHSHVRPIASNDDYDYHYNNYNDSYVTPSPATTAHPYSSIHAQENRRINHRYSFHHPPPPVFSPQVRSSSVATFNSRSSSPNNDPSHGSNPYHPDSVAASAYDYLYRQGSH